MDGRKDGEGRVDQGLLWAFGLEPCDIGRDDGPPGSADFGVHGSGFSGAGDYWEHPRAVMGHTTSTRSFRMPWIRS